MLQLCICDDNPKHAQYTKKLVTGCIPMSEFEINCFSSAEAVLYHVKNNYYIPDIAIIEIELEGINGIELSRQLNRHVPGCCIIFLTGHAKYCSDVYGTEHIFFILKNKAAQYMSIALEKALNLIANRSNNYITISSNSSTIVLQPAKITFIESSLRKLYLHTEDNCYEIYGKLDDFLSESQRRFFIRCHQSYLVNLKYLTGINTSHFILANGMTIPISRSRYLYSKEQFYKYLHLGTGVFISSVTE